VSVSLEPTVPPAALAGHSLFIAPWVDDLIDSLGHDPRSHYVEQFWLGTLGPSTTWLLRRLAARFDVEPDGFDLALSDTARALGLGDKGGRHSPFVRALIRLCQFDLARASGDVLEVRRKLPPLTRRQLMRLPPDLREAHDEFQRAPRPGPTSPDPEQLHHRARQLALSLVELGEERAAVERQLLHWRFHPALASAATTWAWDRRAAQDPRPAS
jgi:hypothetical protein